MTTSNTFKKGDLINIAGRFGQYEVSYTDGPYVYYKGKYPSMNEHFGNCTLVKPTPKFNPGDVVTNGTSTNTIQCVKTRYGYRDGAYDYYDGPIAYDYVSGGWDRETTLSLVRRAKDSVIELVKAGRMIDAIKEHRVIHGTGLKESKDAVEALRETLRCEGQTLGDILATALKPYRPAIVARKHGLEYRPSTHPVVHANAAFAKAEAERLAIKHPGCEFGTFVLTSTSAAPAPVATTVAV